VSGERRSAERSGGAILFDLVLVAFAGLLVVTSLGLRPGVGTVPLLVGVPTLLGAIVLLGFDLFPRPPREDPAAEEASGGLRGLLAAAAEEEDEAIADPTLRGRQVGFALWTIAFVVLATFTSFYVAVPVALVAILVAVRLNWLAIVLVVAGTLAGFYGLFDLFLGVRL
jgi:hypothetical protein